MGEATLALYVLYLGLAFGLRSLLQWRSTGSTGFVGIGGRPGSAEWLAGVLFAVALVLGVAAPVLMILDRLEPIELLDSGAAHVVGVVLAVIGIGLTLYAQSAMGSSWRIGVDPDERTELVTQGPFAVVRNPIFAAMIPTGLGLTLMVPNAVALAGLLALVIALELQVRVVEEPYLLRAQGRSYADYAARTGRFVPGIGKLSRGA
ncbi:MAG: isoprenylcysteine carboxylmethyltransferase family protein [Solirubrobacterales bacterium]|nr:isoprenylcysteine carboxylmethyltransferase family protein [Solirubrobacterales bacterium]